jgi:hypothetical protein
MELQNPTKSPLEQPVPKKKKVYGPPKLTSYGDIRAITQGGGRGNFSDSGKGTKSG